MTFYAKFDNTKKVPTPVLGYYDTDFHDYPKENFSASHFVELTKEQWESRKDDSHVHQKKMIDKPSLSPAEIEEKNKAIQKAKAHALFDESHKIILHFYEEDVPVNKEWKEYRKTLRSIINGSNDKIPDTPDAPTFE